MADLEIFSDSHGQRLQVRTWQANIAAASEIVIAFRSVETPPATTTLPATVISSFPAGAEHDPIVAGEYAVEALIPPAWGSTRIGTWIAAVRATYPSAVITGDPFTLAVRPNPTT